VNHSLCIRILSIIIIIAFCTATQAAELPEWQKLNFLRYKPTQFIASDDQIEIVSESASSMLYRPLSDNEKVDNNLSWSWKVNESSVLPTPLDVSPGDDRILGVYIFFTREPVTNIDKALLSKGNYIAYIWGSSHNVDDTIKSKDSRGRFIIVRPHNEKHNIWYNESFDYKKDFQKAFGYEGYPAFIAIAADTDDSNAKTIAFIKDIKFY